MSTIEEQVVGRNSFGNPTRATMFKVTNQIADQVKTLIMHTIHDRIWGRQAEDVCKQVKIQIWNHLTGIENGE